MSLEVSHVCKLPTGLVPSIWNFRPCYVYVIYVIIVFTGPFTMPVIKGHTVAMVTYCIKKVITMSSPIIGQFFGTTIVASSDKEWF